METVNKTLLMSLKQEVITLNEAVTHLVCLNGSDDDIRSWLFPNKPHNYVTELVHSEKLLEGNNFKTYLELIIDRLYVGIRLILNYVEANTEIQKENRFIHRPKLITLGFTFQNLWETILNILPRNMSENNKETATKDATTTTDEAIQTDIISLNRCDSCSSAMLCMKNLLQSLDKENLVNKKRLLRPKIFDITQFGCMLQTTTAVENSINSLYDKLFSLERDKEIFQRENKLLKLDSVKKSEKIAFLEKEVEILKDKCEKDTVKITVLSNEYEELCRVKDRQDYQIKSLIDVVNNLNNSVKIYDAKLVKVAFEKEALALFYKKLMKNQLDVIKFYKSLDGKLAVVETEQVLMMNGCKELEKMVDSTNKRLKDVSVALTTTEMKLNELKLQDSGVVLLESKLQELKKALAMRKQEDGAKASMKSLQPNSFQVKGNPLEDLTRQLEENTEAIKRLKEENLKLDCIISKLSCLKK